MVENIKGFFDRCVEDFSSFDGEVISSRYLAPYLAVSRDGDIWECSRPVELVDYFQTLLDKHSAQGVLSCQYSDLEWAAIGNRCFSASVTWTMMGAENNVISTWRESYNLMQTDSGLKIFTSIDH
jgi:hypothetical protein